MYSRCVYCGADKERHSGLEMSCLGSLGEAGKTFDSLDLPDGKICNDCVHVARCCLIFGHAPTDTYCDFYPRRFQARKV